MATDSGQGSARDRSEQSSIIDQRAKQAVTENVRLPRDPAGGDDRGARINRRPPTQENPA